MASVNVSKEKEKKINELCICGFRSKVDEKVGKHQ